MLNNNFKHFSLQSTPSGSLHAGDAHKAEGKRTGAAKGRQSETLKPSNQGAGQQGGGFGSTQVGI